MDTATMVQMAIDDGQGFDCSMCGSSEIKVLGIMGRVVHYRCKSCGSDYSAPLSAFDLSEYENMDMEGDEA